MFHQQKSHTICQNRIAKKHGGKHRDPRCSLKCRNCWAEKEAAMMICQLSKVQHSHAIYFGNIQIQADLSLNGHLLVRKRFLKQLRDWKDQGNPLINFRATSEIGRDGRIHYHYFMYTGCLLTHSTVRQFWETACNPFGIILAHDPPKKGIVACSKYMFKDLLAYRHFKKWMQLFGYNTLNITWQTRGFFQPNREAVKQIVVNGWRQKTP